MVRLWGSQNEPLESPYLKVWSKELVQHFGPRGENPCVHRIWSVAFSPAPTLSAGDLEAGDGRHYPASLTAPQPGLHVTGLSTGRNTLGKAYFSSSVRSEGEDISSGESPKIDQPLGKEAMNNFITVLTLS